MDFVICGRRSTGRGGPVKLLPFLVTMYLHSLPNTITHTILTCDSCGGQNRNCTMLVMMWDVVKETQTETVDLKFLVSGNTSMEVDSIPSTIGNNKQKVCVHAPYEWFNVVQMARRKKPYYIVPLTFESFKDFKCVQETFNTKFDESGKMVNWLFIRWIRVTSDPSCFFIEYNFDDESIAVPLQSKKTTRQSEDMPVDTSSNDIKQLYHQLIPIGKS